MITDELREKTRAFQIEEISILLNQCTEAQRNLFDRMYPDGVNNEQVDKAYDQCRRTVEKNKLKLAIPK